jgi:hypothetical protein
VQGGRCITHGARRKGQELIDAKKATIKSAWSPKLTRTFIKWLNHTEEGGKLVYNQRTFVEDKEGLGEKSLLQEIMRNNKKSGAQC